MSQLGHGVKVLNLYNYQKIHDDHRSGWDVFVYGLKFKDICGQLEDVKTWCGFWKV